MAARKKTGKKAVKKKPPRWRTELPETKPVKEKRIQLIEQMMQSHEFVRTETVLALSKRWGCSIQTLREDAAEAHRRILRGVPDEEYRARCLAYLDTITQLAIEEGKYQNAISAVEVALRARGLHTQRVILESHERLTPMQLATTVVNDPMIRPLIEKLLLPSINTEGIQVDEREASTKTREVAAARRQLAPHVENHQGAIVEAADAGACCADECE